MIDDHEPEYLTFTSELSSLNADAVYDVYLNVPPRDLPDAEMTLELEYVGSIAEYERLQQRWIRRVARSIRAWLYAKGGGNG